MAARASERRRVGLTARRIQRASRFYGQFVGLMKVILPTVATALLLICRDLAAAQRAGRAL